MQYIEDTSGRRYALVINPAEIAAVKSRLGIDLMDFSSKNPLLWRKGTPPSVVDLVNVVFALVESEALAFGLTDETWAVTMATGGKMEQAVDRLYGEWATFLKWNGMPLAAAAVTDSQKKTRRAVAAV